MYIRNPKIVTSSPATPSTNSPSHVSVRFQLFATSPPLLIRRARDECTSSHDGEPQLALLAAVEVDEEHALPASEAQSAIRDRQVLRCTQQRRSTMCVSIDSLFGAQIA